jgi:WD repeat-containing protein 19
VQITDRHGEIIDEIPMLATTPVLDLVWDRDGDCLAVLQEGNGIIPLWSLSNRRVVPLDTGLKDPTFISWSKSGPQLAVGTAKGNLLIYNKTKKQKTSVVGKHAKRISCGEWSKTGNKLVLGSDDKTITISNEIGDTLIHSELKDVPSQIVFSPKLGQAPGNDRRSEEVVLSVNVAGQSLLILNTVDEKDDPIELCFTQANNPKVARYGDILKHQWITDGLLLVGFSQGNLVLISTASHEIGVEKHATRGDPNSLITFAYNPQLGKVATAGSSGVSVFDIRDLTRTDTISLAELENGSISDLQWSPDGQILSIATLSGNIYNFLVKMSSLNGVYRESVGYLSSLRELSVVECARRSRPVDVTLRLEPTFMAVGVRHVAAGMNNRVFYHRISGGQVVYEQEYVGTVREVQLNANYAAVMTDGKVTVHLIEAPSQAVMQQQTRTFPGRDEAIFGKISCMALTDDFLFYGTETGSLEVFFLNEFTILSAAELRLDRGISRIYPNAMGTRIVVIDSGMAAYLYNPVTGGGSVNQSLIRFEQAPQMISTVMWDTVEKNIIMIGDGKCLHSYVYVSSSVKGSVLTKLGPVDISAEGEILVKPEKIEYPSENVPLLCINGVLTLQTPSGNLTTFPHPFFDRINGAASDWGGGRSGGRPRGGGGGDSASLKAQFCQCISLLKLDDAWTIALQLDRRPYWFALSNKAMEMLNVELAIRVYRQLGDAAMVMALQDLQQIEDKNLLAGHVSLLFGDYGRAQELFLQSTYPMAALNMQRDLLQWEQALKLAHVIDMQQVPDVSVKFALQLELREDFSAALHTFEQAMHVQDAEGQNLCPQNLITVCMAGIARCNLRLGNLRQGIRLVQDLADPQLYTECGQILEQQKQYSEAAVMHLKAQNYDRAAEIFTNHLIVADKGRIAEAASILEKATNMQLNSKFAKVCATCGKYAEAAAAYERAQDWDKVSRPALVYCTCIYLQIYLSECVFV